MLDSSMCFADLSVGDWFETNLYSENGSRRYRKLAGVGVTDGGHAENAIELTSGHAVRFEPEDRVTLVG
jgi:hypothetical protein